MAGSTEGGEERKRSGGQGWKRSQSEYMRKLGSEQYLHSHNSVNTISYLERVT